MKERLLLILFIGFFLGPLMHAEAQGLCDRGGGGFSLDKTEGCAPLTVNITNEVPNTFADGYVINYDGRATTNVAFIDGLSSYNYCCFGEYTILQKVVTSTGQFYACKTIKVIETRAVGATYSSCGGSKVIVTLTDDIILKAYDRLEFDWGDGTTTGWKKGDDLTIEYSYKDTSIKPTISIVGHYDGGKACSKGFARSLPVVFQQAQLQDIAINKVEMKGNGSMEIEYLGLTGVYTDLKYSTDNGSTFTTAVTRSGGGVQIARINGLNASQIYKVKLGSRDLCGGVLDSELITSMVLKGATANESNTLSWNEYPANNDFVSYELLRDGVSIESFSDIKTLSYTDENVQCGDNFEYQLIVTTSKITSVSAPVSVKTVVNSPGAITEASVTVDGDDLITIQAAVPGAGGKSNYEVMIEKAEAGSSTFKRLATLYNEVSYNDPDVIANELSYCYRLTYRNACGQLSPATDPICSIKLTMDIPVIQWTTDKPFLDDVAAYEVTQTSPSGQNIIDVNLNASYVPKFDTQTDLSYTFQVKATSANGLFQSVSNILSINRNITVYLPTAFSPDGDGRNDLFQAFGTLYRSFAMSVFNKWGEVVFHTSDINEGWDGTTNGGQAPMGSYVYKVTVVDILDQEVSKTGTFMLLR